MATTNYQFPTITAEDTINGVSAINNLATAVDAALKKVDDKASGGEAYALPPATTSTLGGVKIGTGVSATPDGTISVNTTWLAQQINTAVAAYMSSHYTTGTTWGQINANGFIYPSA